MSTALKTHQKAYFEINKSKNYHKNPLKTATTDPIETQIIPPSLYNYLLSLLPSQEVIENYTKTHKNIMPIRGNIIDWLLVVTEKTKISQDTFFKTIMLFDKYISKLTTEIEDSTKLHFIAVTCFFIIFKFEETGVMTLEFVEEKLLCNKYTRKQIVAQETQILIAVNFKLNFPSINTFSNIIIESLKNNNNSNFIKKLDCIYNFVNKISLFVDEFIFNSQAVNIALINFQTTLTLMKKLNPSEEDKFLEIEGAVKMCTKDFINLKQVDIMAPGLFLAIMNQEQQGCHMNLFQSYYTNIDEILKQEMISKL